MPSPSPRQDRNRFYTEILTLAAKKGRDQLYKVTRYLSRHDLFFLLTRILNRPDVDTDWLYDRCMEVQAEPDNCIDLWAREHYKSTIITFAKTIQDILNNPEITIGIFSHTKPIAKSFLQQIKEECEKNEKLQALFPDIFWRSKREALQKSYCWNMDSGITVRRKGNPKVATVEAHGLVDGQPTSKHFDILIFDDVVTLESVTTPEQIQKVTQAYRISLNLGKRGGRKRIIGTRYHLFDTYREIMKTEDLHRRVYPGTADGTPDGAPVFLTQAELDQKRREMGPFVYACQILQNPAADANQDFDADWLKFWTPTMRALDMMNLYILVDPAGKKNATSDYTVMWVIGLNSDGKYYIFDVIRDKLNLTERTKKLVKLHKTYKPVMVYYEEVGLQADVEHIEHVMGEILYHFDITPVTPPTRVPKNTRIKALIPLFEQGRIFLPHHVHYVDYEGKLRDLISVFKEDEYEVFPFVSHDDMLDPLANLADQTIEFEFPQSRKPAASLGAGYGTYG